LPDGFRDARIGAQTYLRTDFAESLARMDGMDGMNDQSPRLRRLTPADAEPLAVFYNGLSPAALRTFCPLGPGTTPEACAAVGIGNLAGAETRYDLAAWRDGGIVGWGFIQGIEAEQPEFGLGVADDHRGRGLGGRLMDAVLAEAGRRALPSIFLIVVTDNTVAWRLYESRGFVKYDEYLDATSGLSYFRMRRESPARQE
jgi:ribosomal-protein-alanine N-acetyltransferase